MALRTVLNSDTFKMATLNLVWLNDNEEWSSGEILDAANALRILSDEGAKLAVNTDSNIVAAVDKALRRSFPNYKDWADESLHAYLRQKSDLLEQLASGQTKDPNGLKEVHALCMNLWTTLAHIKNQEMRNGHI